MAQIVNNFRIMLPAYRMGTDNRGGRGITLSVFLDAHHRRRRAVRLGNNVERAALKVVATEDARPGLKGFFVGLLVPLAEIPQSPQW
jgi:hypothetical protein